MIPSEREGNKKTKKIMKSSQVSSLLTEADRDSHKQQAGYRG